MKVVLLVFLLSVLVNAQVQAQVLTQWTPFSDCSETCNINNPLRTRTRTCTPSNLCQGFAVSNTIPCNTQYACPDYRLGDWGSWSACSQSCRSTQSNPTQVRTRPYCLNNSTSTYQCTSNYMISYQPCNLVACSVVKSCSSLNFTFVFVLDGSSSVDPQEWRDEKMLVTQFVNSSAFGKNPNIDVALVTFSTTAEIKANCGTFKSFSSFVTFMNDLKKPEGGTAIHQGLNYSQTAYNNCIKLNMYPVIILLTDGEENIDKNIDSNIILENQLKSNALVVAGAVKVYNRGEIDRITSYIVNGQNVSYSLYATNFTDLLNSFGNQFYQYIISKSQCQTQQGQWTTWAAWSNCSVYCGATGYMERSRSCINVTTNITQGDCEPDGNIANLDEMTCSFPCRTFSAWSSWGACSASCRLESGPGVSSRSRTCLPGLGSCIGDLAETQECNTNIPCQGNYSEWGAWSTCSETCQSNVSVSPFQIQTRKCLNFTLNGGCSGPASQTRNCSNGISCPGILSAWGAWELCSASCQMLYTPPTQSSTRQCIGATFNGSCNGELLTKTQNCSEKVYCPGTISGWSSWSACSASCNNLATVRSQNRSQYCHEYSTFDPSYKGCDGIPTSEQRSCNDEVGCPGNYSEWGAWSTCSESCQSNPSVSPFQTQTRQCLNFTLNGNCSGPASLTRNCSNGISCPGILSAWGAWELCSASCQMLYTPPTQSSTRQCIGATFNGSCNGEPLTKTQNCSEKVYCPGNILDWSSWGACSASCNNLVTVRSQNRSRSCDGYSWFDPSYKGCDGIPTSDQRSCNDEVGCPGNYSEWGAWSTCSESCQNNPSVSPFQIQTRQCLNFTLNAGCSGPASQTRNCSNGISCPDNYGQWGAWSTCSESCQSNTSVSPFQTQTRQCLNFTLTVNCSGPASQTRNCSNGISCPGVLSSWSAWGDCSATCQLNSVVPQKNRTRTCSGASFGGNCSGEVLFQSSNCAAEIPCPGVLSSWSAWGDCSATCQLNFVVPQKIMTRTCSGASFGGNCGGEVLSQSSYCVAEILCPGTLSGWGDWGACSASCDTQVNGLYQSRNRTCDGVSTWNPNFKGCNDTVLNQQQLCNQNVSCPGVLSSWSAWDNCSDTCQLNSVVQQRNRTRTCSGASLGGNCGGEVLSQSSNCVAEIPCPGRSSASCRLVSSPLISFQIIFLYWIFIRYT